MVRMFIFSGGFIFVGYLGVGYGNKSNLYEHSNRYQVVYQW